MSYIVAATKNAHKVEEYRELLKDQNVEIKSLLDYPGYTEVEESGSTFQENTATYRHLPTTPDSKSKHSTAPPEYSPPDMRQPTANASPNC